MLSIAFLLLLQIVEILYLITNREKETIYNNRDRIFMLIVIAVMVGILVYRRG